MTAQGEVLCSVAEQRATLGKRLKDESAESTALKKCSLIIGQFKMIRSLAF